MIKHIVMWKVKGESEAEKAQAISIIKQALEALPEKIMKLYLMKSE